MEKRLYIPVETKNREFDAKLLLACTAAESGYTVVIGYKKQLLKHLDELPPGIFFDKSLPLDKLQKFVHYKKLGHKLVAHDEEGLAPFSLEEYQRRRQYCNASLEHCEYMLAWGEWQADFIRAKAPLFQEKVVATGHPRVDLTRKELRGFYQEEVEQLLAQYGRFLLLNTNFSFGNHFYGEGGFVEALEAAGKIRDEVHRQFYLGIQHHQERLFEEFVSMIKALRERFPGMTIIVRPHPSENHEKWCEVLPEHEKIIVKHEGNVLPWLMAAQAVIHNSCTTGIEAYLLERPVIAYLPVRNEAFEGYLANPLSELALTREELLKTVARYLEKGLPPQPDSQKQALAKQHITGLDGALSSDRIVKLLDTVVISPGNSGRTAYQVYHRLKKMREKISIHRIFGMDANSQQDLAERHKKQKFPGVELDELLVSLAKLQTLSGRFADLHAVSIAPNLFQITQGSRS